MQTLAYTPVRSIGTVLQCSAVLLSLSSWHMWGLIPLSVLKQYLRCWSKQRQPAVWSLCGHCVLWGVRLLALYKFLSSSLQLPKGIWERWSSLERQAWEPNSGSHSTRAFSPLKQKRRGGTPHSRGHPALHTHHNNAQVTGVFHRTAVILLILIPILL